jgi:hypothetical protein
MLALKLFILFADISIGVLVYTAISRITQNEELTFLIELSRKRKKKSSV